MSHVIFTDELFILGTFFGLGLSIILATIWSILP